MAGLVAGCEEPRYFLVMDFEATCERDDRSWPNEIIEFPAVVLDATTREVVSEFREFVRPTERPQLTAFCTELTGIRQAEVDPADTLDGVLPRFARWLEAHVSGEPQAALPVTCGDWDLRQMLPRESKRKGLQYPSTLCRWCNIKVAYREATGRRAGGMAEMLSTLGMELIGRHHSGIDDARNIARILVELLRRFHLRVTHTAECKRPKPSQPALRAEAKPFTPAGHPVSASAGTAPGSAGGGSGAQAGGGREKAAAVTAPRSEPARASPATAQVQEHRLGKKLQQMEALEKKLQDGKPLNDDQMQKLERIGEVRQQLAELDARGKGPVVVDAWDD